MKLFRLALCASFALALTGCGNADCPKDEYCPEDPQLQIGQTQSGAASNTMVPKDDFGTQQFTQKTLLPTHSDNVETIDGLNSYNWERTIGEEDEYDVDIVGTGGIPLNKTITKCDISTYMGKETGTAGDFLYGEGRPFLGIVNNAGTYFRWDAVTKVKSDEKTPEFVGQRTIDLAGLGVTRQSMMRLMIGMQYTGCSGISCPSDIGIRVDHMQVTCNYTP